MSNKQAAGTIATIIVGVVAIAELSSTILQALVVIAMVAVVGLISRKKEGAK